MIKNKGTVNRSLGNWTVRDVNGHVYKFPTFTIKPGYAVTLHTGSGTNNSTHVYWGMGNYVWNNAGDTAYLRNSSGTLQDSCKFTSSSGNGYLYC